MKVAVLSESAADEAAIRIFVDALRGELTTERPSIQLETQRMTEEARRLAQDLDELERWFPAGFGTFARDVRSWLTHRPRPKGFGWLEPTWRGGME